MYYDKSLLRLMAAFQFCFTNKKWIQSIISFISIEAGSLGGFSMKGSQLVRQNSNRVECVNKNHTLSIHFDIPLIVCTRTSAQLCLFKPPFHKQTL